VGANIPLVVFSRGYAPQARRRDEEYDENYTAPPSSSGSNVDDPGAEEGSEEAGPKVDLVPFSSLKGYLNYDTLKALVFKPFTLSSMSEVQKRVLTLMPYLAGGKLSSILRQSEVDGQLVDNPDAVEDESGQKRGREDLLVKAKTGTGKTIVSGIHLVFGTGLARI
jgi:ATP-dependent RNA helicase MSS116